MKTKRKTVRKPKGLFYNGNWFLYVNTRGIYHSHSSVMDLDLKQAKKVANWLLRAADYLEAKNRGKR